MRRIPSRAISGVARVSITITPSSPTITPVLGSPSAVKAYALFDRRRKLIFLGLRSDWDAKVVICSLSSQACRQRRAIVAVSRGTKASRIGLTDNSRRSGREFRHGTSGKDPPRRRAGRAEGDLAGSAEDRARAAEKERAPARPRARRAGFRPRRSDLRSHLPPAEHPVRQPQAVQFQP